MIPVLIDIDEPDDLQTDLPQAAPMVRCRLIVHCLYADEVYLSDVFDPARHHLVFSEMTPGNWVALLMLHPGNHHWLLTARLVRYAPPSHLPAPRLIQRRLLLNVPLSTNLRQTQPPVCTTHHANPIPL